MSLVDHMVNADPEVNKAHMIEWVKALESGDYKQGQAQLHGTEGNTWCCLGVACDVAMKNGVALKREVVSHDGHEKFGDNAAYLPKEVMAWLGVESWNPRFAGRNATFWNDTAVTNFEGIAALIRSEYGITEDDLPLGGGFGF